MDGQAGEKARQMVRQYGLDRARTMARETMNRYEPASTDWSFWARVSANIEREASSRGYVRKGAIMLGLVSLIPHLQLALI